MKQRPEIPKTMAAVLLSGHGGLDKLTYRTDVRTPIPATGEVLIEIAAAGVNSTDINTRIAWYSKAVAAGTNARAAEGFAGADNIDGSWSGARIRGADCCGRIVAVGEGVEPGRIGERAIVRTMLRSYVDYRPFECWTFGSECDGAFAQYTKAPARESYKVSCNWSDAELASIPCAFSTAEGMLDRASVGAERVLVTGAPGGVGSAVVQLCKRRRAQVAAVCSPAKAPAVRALGADQTVDRDADVASELGEDCIDVVIDLVAGRQWPRLLKVLRRGGRLG